MSDRIGERYVDAPENGISPFLDWAADDFIVGEYRYILVVNRASILSWVFFVKCVNSSSDFIRYTGVVGYVLWLRGLGDFGVGI